MKDSDRRQAEKETDHVPDISQLHLVRLFYANDLPGSLEHLISGLYTLRPPLRDDYGCVKLIFPNDKMPEIKAPQCNEDGKLTKPQMDSNYYRVVDGTLYMAKYKTWKTYGLLINRVDPRLKDIIDLWLEKSKNREYLITKRDGSLYVNCDTFWNDTAKKES